MRSHRTRAVFFLGTVALLVAMLVSTMYAPYRGEVAALAFRAFSEARTSLAGVFFVESKSIAELQSTHAAVSDSGRRVRILLVPGHEPSFGGTAFAGLFERDVVVDLAHELERLFLTDPHYSVMVARTKEDWHPLLKSYFEKHREDIIDFRQEHLQEMGRLVKRGLIKEVTAVSHNTAPRDVALRLYGINAWANEQDVDIVLHLHINDHERRSTRAEGKYSGFSIYVPERQYSNSTSSRVIADALFDRLSTVLAPSNMPLESDGIVEDQELIAIGRYNTVDASSVLVEYGYIYEPHFHTEGVRDALIKEYAYQTFKGVQEFFGTKDTTSVFATTFLPHTWDTDLTVGSSDVVGTLALQRALMLEGLYPPQAKSLQECPLTGSFKKCTEGAVRAYHERHGITGESGVGEKTREQLHRIYSPDAVEENRD